MIKHIRWCKLSTNWSCYSAKSQFHQVHVYVTYLWQWCSKCKPYPCLPKHVAPPPHFSYILMFSNHEWFIRTLWLFIPVIGYINQHCLLQVSIVNPENCLQGCKKVGNLKVYWIGYDICYSLLFIRMSAKHRTGTPVARKHTGFRLWGQRDVAEWYMFTCEGHRGME